MFQVPKEPMKDADVQPTWEYLVKQERSLQRNVRILGIIQPLGASICAFNLLLVAMNFLLFVAGDLIGEFFNKLPLLPSLVESMPRGSWSGVIWFSILLAYILPLMICGAIAGVFYYLSWKKGNTLEPLNGTVAQCAIALQNKAEHVYDLRRQMPRWSTYLETGILTAITAFPFLLMFIDYASEGAMVFSLVLVLLALLVVLFVFFWLFAFVLYTLSLINSLICFSPSEWKLYEMYHWVCDYCEFAPEQGKE